MIIDETIEQSRKATISTSNSDSIGTFRIKESAKAFSILSSSLYQNPIRSIIRELGCNARDAHVAAKNPEPWTLSLPSALSPEFAVSDRGTGLSHQEVMQIYTTYFESTKTNSNDFVGALGLGSKSPFSYTDNFTVTSVKDGTKNIYSTFLTEEQIPSIVLLDSSPTSEPNGVEVRFSVKSEHFNKFRTEAIEALRFFDQKPIGFPSGNANVIENINGIDHVRVVNYNSYNSSNHPLVIMGGVAYTFDAKNPEFNKFSVVLTSRGHNMLIRANIGEVDIQPSREGLTMTKKTIEFISLKLGEALKKIESDIEKKISSASTEWDGIVLRETLASSGTEYEQRLLKSLAKNSFTLPARYSGRLVTGYINRKTTGVSKPFTGITSRVTSNIAFIINDAKSTLRDIHECVRIRPSSRGKIYVEIVEINPIQGVSAVDLQKEIAKHTCGKVPELSSVVCADLITKKKIVGIVYRIAPTSGRQSSKNQYGHGLSRSSQECFKPGSYFVELDKENNVVDEKGNVVANFWQKYSMYRDLEGSLDVFAIKHNSKFDRTIYKRFLPDLDKYNLEKIKELKAEKFFTFDQSSSYELRSVFGYGHFEKFVAGLRDPLAEIVKKFNQNGRNTSDLVRYESMYPGSTKHIADDINDFKTGLSTFIKRYESILVAYYRDTKLLDDLVEFANWRYDNKFAPK